MLDYIKLIFRNYLFTYINIRIPIIFYGYVNKIWRINFYVKAPIEDIRYSIFGSSTESFESDPFISLIKKFINGDFNQKHLETYFKEYLPVRFSDVIGYTDNSKILNSPANLIQYLLPWIINNINNNDYDKFIQKLYENNPAKRKCKEYGINLRNNVIHGTQSIGPVSDKMIKCEFERYLSTYGSIIKSGFKNNHCGSGIIHAVGLRKRGTIKYHITDGLHRSAVLLASGHKYIAINTSLPIINYENLDKLYSVNNNLVTLNGARFIFEYYFNGNGKT
jgi:hypothetical protein